jgi:hypothetical protein
MLRGEGGHALPCSAGKDRRRHLVQQRLKHVVVAAVDQQDGGIGMPQGVRRRDPGKAADGDYDAVTLPVRAPRRRKLPRQAGARPTSRSWITSFGLFAIRRYSPMAAATRFWGQMG